MEKVEEVIEELKPAAPSTSSLPEWLTPPVRRYICTAGLALGAFRQLLFLIALSIILAGCVLITIAPQTAKNPVPIPFLIAVTFGTVFHKLVYFNLLPVGILLDGAGTGWVGENVVVASVVFFACEVVRCVFRGAWVTGVVAMAFLACGGLHLQEEEKVKKPRRTPTTATDLAPLVVVTTAVVTGFLEDVVTTLTAEEVVLIPARLAAAVGAGGAAGTDARTVLTAIGRGGALRAEVVITPDPEITAVSEGEVTSVVASVASAVADPSSVAAGSLPVVSGNAEGSEAVNASVLSAVESGAASEVAIVSGATAAVVAGEESKRSLAGKAARERSDAKKPDSNPSPDLNPEWVPYAFREGRHPPEWKRHEAYLAKQLMMRVKLGGNLQACDGGKGRLAVVELEKKKDQKEREKSKVWHDWEEGFEERMVALDVEIGKMKRQLVVARAGAKVEVDNERLRDQVDRHEELTAHRVMEVVGTFVEVVLMPRYIATGKYARLAYARVPDHGDARRQQHCANRKCHHRNGRDTNAAINSFLSPLSNASESTTMLFG
ncbi:hypothetical protein HDU98_010921 [Podochytrium sp. JEL0797]|nr:hypothetical protein HDU98_010921 [Podochytrium sp. JEL0797]